MARPSTFKDPIVIPVKIEKSDKAALIEHCKREGLTLTGLIRKLLREYAEREGFGGKR